MMLQRVRQFVRQHALFDADTRLMVALSGGSDSVALAVLMRELDAAGDVRLVGFAHFNHQLRDQATRDERFSAALAASLGEHFAADRVDVAVRARRERRSLEDAARRARYEFFDRAGLELGAEVVALGHTRDDQAETFLLRLMRGAGPRGRAGMYPRRGRIVRPLLDCRRSELRAYLHARQISYVEDETNADVAVPRNRVRAELLPLMAERFNPAIADVLADAAELDREVWAWLESVADQFEGDLASGDQTPAELDVARLNAAPPPLRRLVLWRAMNKASDGRVSFAHVDAALKLLDPAHRGGHVDAPRHSVHRVAARLVLRTKGVGGRRGRRVASLPAVNLFAYPLSIPGEVPLPEAGCTVTAEFRGVSGGLRRDARTGKGLEAVVRRDLCGGALTVRSRHPGDRFRPVGVGGRKKLQDYFVDRKIALDRRDRVPLVVDESDRIVWVAGYGIDEAFQVTDPSQSVLLLRLKQA
jgi:tRNA(Ile)-lysidine synthase